MSSATRVNLFDPRKGPESITASPEEEAKREAERKLLDKAIAAIEAEEEDYKRPLNLCPHCAYGWYPRGRDYSPKCPDCGERSTEEERDVIWDKADSVMLMREERERLEEQAMLHEMERIGREQAAARKRARQAKRAARAKLLGRVADMDHTHIYARRDLSQFGNTVLVIVLGFLAALGALMLFGRG